MTLPLEFFRAASGQMKAAALPAVASGGATQLVQQSTMQHTAPRPAPPKVPSPKPPPDPQTASGLPQEPAPRVTAPLAETPNQRLGRTAVTAATSPPP